MTKLTKAQAEAFPGTAPNDAGLRIARMMRKVFGAQLRFSMTVPFPHDERLWRATRRIVDRVQVGPERSHIHFSLSLRAALAAYDEVAK